MNSLEKISVLKLKISDGFGKKIVGAKGSLISDELRGVIIIAIRQNWERLRPPNFLAFVILALLGDSEGPNGQIQPNKPLQFPQSHDKQIRPKFNYLSEISSKAVMPCYPCFRSISTLEKGRKTQYAPFDSSEFPQNFWLQQFCEICTPKKIKLL